MATGLTDCGLSTGQDERGEQRYELGIGPCSREGEAAAAAEKTRSRNTSICGHVTETSLIKSMPET